jgi:hypothetical protein
MIAGLLKDLKAAARYGLWAELASLFRILCELLLLTVWFTGLSNTIISWSASFFILALFFIGSYLFSRWLTSRKWSLGLERGLLIGWIVFIMLLGWHLLAAGRIHMTSGQFFAQILAEHLSPQTTFVFWALLFSLICVLRGVQINRYPAGGRDLVLTLRWGLVLFGIFALLFGREHFSFFLPAFFFFLLACLTGMSLARVAGLAEQSGGRLPGFTWHWAAGIAGTAGLVTLLGLLASLIINLDVAELLGKGLVTLLQLVTGAMVVITSPLLVVIIAVVQFLLTLVAPELGEVIDQDLVNLDQPFLEQWEDTAVEKTHIDPALFLMIGVVLLIVVIAVIQLKRRNGRRLPPVEEFSTDIREPQKKANPLRDLFASRERRKKRASAKSLLAAARIRFAYSQLMELCEKLGKARPRAVTPLEFIPRMDSLFPDNPDDLRAITQAYIKVRYGEYPETDAEVTAVLDAWKRLNELGKEQLQEHGRHLRGRRG